MTSILWTPLGVRLPQPYCKQYPHPPQEAFLWLDNYDAFYGGAAGPGKSSALLTAALQYVDVPYYAALIIRRRMTDLKDPGALIPRSKEWLWDTDAKWNDNEHQWTFPSKAVLQFGYMDKKDDHLQYQGAEFQFIGVDEASQIRAAQLRYMFSRLRQPDYEETGDPRGLIPLRMRLASNPGDVSHEFLKARYIDKQIDPEDEEDTWERARDRVFIRAKLEDNPSVNQETYRRGLANLEPEVRAQLLDGDWDARMPGQWYFEDSQLASVAELGRMLEGQLQAGDLGEPVGGVLPLGIDWGENTHALLGWPLEAGGIFIAREFVGDASEPGASTEAILAMREEACFEAESDLGQEGPAYLPFGRARYDAAGVQSQRTFDRVAFDLLGGSAPRKSAIPFGGRATTVGGARKSYKGLGCTYLRRLARRAADPAAAGVQVLAVSPRCPVLLRQLKALERDMEDPTGSWKKDEDQHGPDAAIALVAPIAKRHRELVAA